MTALARLPHDTVSAGRPGYLSLVVAQIGYATRELWRSRIVLVFTFVLPIVWLVMIGLIAGNDAVDETTGVRVMQFATPMAAVLGVLLTAYPPVAYGLALAREQKILKRLRGTPLPPSAYLVGRVGGAVILALAAIVAMLVVGVVAYQFQPQWRTGLATLATLGLGIACLASLGLAVGAVASSASMAQTFAIASAIIVAFLSGLMTFGLTPPPWMDAVASVFPVRYLLEPLQEQLNPFSTGSGWDLGALGILAAWGLAGLAIASWALRREPTTRGAAAMESAASVGAGLHGRAAPRPSGLRLVFDQTRWANSGAVRDAGWVFFAVAMPVGLYALMASQLGDADFGTSGMPFSLYFAIGMAAYGASVTAFVNMPEAVATARDRLVLKRLRGTPLAPWHYLAGRTSSVLWIAGITGMLVFAAGVAFFNLRLSPTAVPLGLAILLFGTLTMAACGYALVALAPSGRAMAVMSLALLLPLSFISDVFPFGGAMPEWLTTLAAVFPLSHFVHALGAAVDPESPGINWVDLAVLAAWLVGATLVAVRRFRWEPHR